MVQINVTEKNLDKIIESLEKNFDRSNQTLISYLKEVKKKLHHYESLVSLDEIPF